VFGGNDKRSQAGTQVAQAPGQPRLLAIEPLPTQAGEMCQWVPASASNLVAGLWQQTGSPAGASSSAREAATLTRLGRPALGILGEDPYSTFGAVAVDTVRNEIVVSGSHASKIMVYDRLANTPSTATMTEPKRIIQGDEAKLDRNCGIYLDPETGDIYSTSLDVQDLLVIHAQGATGNAPPVRELKTPPRNVSITVDEEAQEIFLPTQNPPSVVVYRKMAAGNEAPLRILEGKRTRLVDPHGVAVDSKNGLLYVGNNTSTADTKGGWTRSTFRAPGDPTPRWEVPDRGEGGKIIVPGTGRFELPAITVYPLKASGDTAPLRVIKGSKTQFQWIARIHLDVEHQELYVANDTDSSILVFRATDDGNAAPIRVIKGPKAGLRNPTDVFVDLKNNELVVANAGNHSATVYSRTANGDVAPLRTIRSGPLGTLAPMLVGPGALTYDKKRDEILVPN
jgi:DNA-binding beta-propeller fold protein YncE